jgi:hypothetical protein
VPKRRHLAVALGPVLLALGCANAPSADERAWADELTATVLRVNDVVALEVLPAYLGEETVGPVTEVDEDVDPDFDALQEACARLEVAAAAVGTASENAPARLETAAKVAREIDRRLTTTAEDCVSAAEVRDVDAFEAIGSDFSVVGELVEQLGHELPEDTKCPERLRSEIVSCELGDEAVA